MLLLSIYPPQLSINHQIPIHNLPNKTAEELITRTESEIQKKRKEKGKDETAIGGAETQQGFYRGYFLREIKKITNQETKFNPKERENERRNQC